LGDAVSRVLSDSPQAALVASRGRERCRRLFDWADVGERYARILTSQVDGPTSISHSGSGPDVRNKP